MAYTQEELMQKLKQQYKTMQQHGRQPMTPIGGMTTQPTPISTPVNTPHNPTPPTPLKASTGKCPQCDMHHPPLKPGEICPMAKTKIGTQKDPSADAAISNFMIAVKTSLITRLSKGDIKDPKKFIDKLTIGLVKYLEKYVDKT